MAPVEKKSFNMQSWADDMEEDAVVLPAPRQVIKGNLRILTEHKLEDGKAVKYIKHFRSEKVKKHKNVDVRRTWQKFGGARDDPAGPNPSNTVVCEDVQMQFLSIKEEEQMDSARELDQDPMAKLIASNANVVKCRLCDQDHWTSKCPYKDQFEAKKDLGLDRTEVSSAAPAGTASASSSNRYIPPSLREGGNKRGDSMAAYKREDHTVRITNLPEEIQDSDIKELFIKIGEVSRIYLARDKVSGQSKGFAFVSFHNKSDAAKAIRIVNGFGYANLILNVEWAKPSTS